jgi:hypothetical protein
MLLVALNAWLSCSAAAQPDDEAEARRMAERMIRQDAIKFLTDREYEIESEAVAGKARAVDPERHVEVEVKELRLVPGHVTTKVAIDTRFEFEGKLTVDDEETDARATATVRPTIDIEADYRIEDNWIHVDARVTDVEFEVELLELEPDDLPGGKRVAEELIVKELKRQKDDLIREINEWVSEQNRR